jgi:hypothetical protein
MTRQPAWAGTAFELAEKSKGALLLDALAEASARRFAGIPDTVLTREQQLRLDLASYEQRISEAQVGDIPVDSAQVDQWKARVFTLTRDYQMLLANLERDYPAYYRLKYDVRTVGVADVRDRLLGDDTALVEYAIGADSVHLFVVTQGDLDVVSVPGRDLEVWIEALRSGITERHYDRYTEAAQFLYERLVAPVRHLLTGRRVIIVPDGPLNCRAACRRCRRSRRG